MQRAFHFLEGPAEVLSASTACRRWRELACAGSVWRIKAEREGILDKAKAFEIEVPLLEDEEAGVMVRSALRREASRRIRLAIAQHPSPHPGLPGRVERRMFRPNVQWRPFELECRAGQVHAPHVQTRRLSFNSYLSRWGVGQVFHGATAFNQQLGGAWSTIEAPPHQKIWMLCDCPGSIVR